MDARVAELMGDYQDKADDVDELLGEERGRGRVRRRLDDFNALIGIVIGLFNEVSNDTHSLVEAMAESRVKKLARASGLSVAKRAEEKGLAVAQLRRELSTCSLRAGMACILDRVHQVGEGAALCSKRRETVLAVEREMHQAREAQWLARVRGSHPLRKGHILRQ